MTSAQGSTSTRGHKDSEAEEMLDSIGTLDPHARERKEAVINLSVLYGNARSIMSIDKRTKLELYVLYIVKEKSDINQFFYFPQENTQFTISRV